MKTTLHTWARKSDLAAGREQRTHVGQRVAAVLSEALTGQGEHPFANLSGPDAEQLISAIERTGGKRTAAEQALLDFLRGPASDGRSKSYLQIEGGELIPVGATRGKAGGRAVLREDERCRLAASGNVVQPQEARAELDARAGRVLGHDPALTPTPFSGTVAQFLSRTGTGQQGVIIEAQRAVCRRAAAEFLTGAVASWVENDMPVPPELVGRRLTVADVVSPGPALREFLDATHIELNDQGEITRYAENGQELGAVVKFSFACRGDLASWSCFYDARAGYFTTIAIQDGIIEQSRTEKLDRPA